MKGNYQQLLMRIIVFPETDCIKTSGKVQYDVLTGDAFCGDYWD